PILRVGIVELHVVEQHRWRVALRVEAYREQLHLAGFIQSLRAKRFLHLGHPVGGRRTASITGREHKAHEPDLAGEVGEMERLFFVRGEREIRGWTNDREAGIAWRQR